MKAKLGIAPIAWWNDDLAELSDDVSLEECLRQASVAGFTGMETGRRFPMNMEELGPILSRYGVSVCGGWFSGLLLDCDIEREKDRVRAQMDFFIAAGAPCIVYGETARSIQGVRSAPLANRPKLSEEEISLTESHFPAEARFNPSPFCVGCGSGIRWRRDGARGAR
jgi:inosose dehydratase